MVLMQAKHLLLLLLHIKSLETARKLYCEAATGSQALFVTKVGKQLPSRGKKLMFFCTFSQEIS